MEIAITISINGHEIKKEKFELQEKIENPVLEKSISTLPLTQRTVNALRAENVESINDLVDKTFRWIRRTPNIGKKSQIEIINALKEQNLELKVEEKIENPILKKDIGELALTQRSVNCLRAERVNLVSELIEKTEWDLLKTPNLGRKSCMEIREALKEHNLKLKDKEK